MKKIVLALVALAAGSLLAQPVITSQPTNQIVLNGSNVTFGVTVSGTGPFTYQWQFKGTNLPNNTITTMAGTNVGSFSGDGGPATSAKLDYPTGVTEDSAGDVYIADLYNNRIRMINTNGIISTVAGTNSATFSGDGGAANLAGLYYPYGICVDSFGDYFIADASHNRIRKVDTNGIITTIAGTNTAGYFGDGGPATNAWLNNPHGVAVDACDNLFIADYGNNRIRRVDTNGFISTVAGTNASGFLGDGGAATNARLASPQGVVVDACGNLFIADYGNNRVRRVNTNGIITTVAGTNSSGYAGDGGAATNAHLSSPTGVAIDAFGYLFIADNGNNRIRQVDANGIITTVAGNGSAGYSGDGGASTNATVYGPFGLTLDVQGGLVIADANNWRIRRVTLGRVPVLQIYNATTNNAGNYQVIVASPSGSITSSVVTLSVVFPPSILGQPQSAVVTNGNSSGFGVTASGTGTLYYQWYFGTNAVGGGTNAALGMSHVAANQAGWYTCVITNAYGCVTSGIATLVVLTPPSIVTQPTVQSVIAGNGVTFSAGVSGTGPFTYQWQFNGTNLPNRNYVITRVAGIAGQGGYNGGDGGPATNASLSTPRGVAVDPWGNFFIADSGNNLIRRVDTNGIITTVAGTNVPGYSGDGGLAVNAELNLPSGVVVDGWGNFYISDLINNRIRRVDTNGYITTFAGTNSAGFSGDGGSAVDGELYDPSGVALDGFGNLFIADSGNHRVRKVTTNGVITTVAGTTNAGFSGDGGLAINAELRSLGGVAVDGFGNLLIADYGNSRIRKVDVNGIITTFAGTNSVGFGGDGGAATNATLNYPEGVAVDAYGDVFIADEMNGRIRMVNVTGTISTVAGNGIGTGYSGDGGLATNAGFYEPTCVGLDAYGNLYAAGDNGIVCKVDLGRTPTLQLNNVGVTNAGNYDVIVTSPYGSVTSSVVSLTVLLPPAVATEPANVSAPVGGSAGFNVAVTNYPPFGYQWFTSSGRTATAVPFMGSFNQVQFVDVIDGGEGYVSPPQVHFIGGSGSGASATAVVYSGINNGIVMDINVNNSGSGYTIPPTIQIDPPSPIVTAVLAGQTNAALAISPVTSAVATNFFVVVTNIYGSVTSTVAALWAFLPPQNFTAGVNGTNLQVQFSGTPYWPYILQSATNLASPVNWESLVTNMADVNGNWSFTVTNPGNLPGCFYRAVAQ